MSALVNSNPFDDLETWLYSGTGKCIRSAIAYLIVQGTHQPYKDQSKPRPFTSNNIFMDVSQLSDAVYEKSPTYQGFSDEERLDVVTDILMDAGVDAEDSSLFIDSRPALDAFLKCDGRDRAERTAWAFCAYITLALKLRREDPLWEFPDPNYYDNMRKYFIELGANDELEEQLNLPDTIVEDAQVDDEEYDDARVANRDDRSPSLSPPASPSPKVMRPKLKRSHAGNGDGEYEPGKRLKVSHKVEEAPVDDEENEDAPVANRDDRSPSLSPPASPSLKTTRPSRDKGSDATDDDENDSNYEPGKKSKKSSRKTKTKTKTKTAKASKTPIPRNGTEAAYRNGSSSSLPPLPTSSSSEVKRPGHQQSRTTEDDESKASMPSKSCKPEGRSNTKAASTTQTMPDVPSAATQPPSPPKAVVHPPPVAVGKRWGCPYADCTQVSDSRGDIERHLLSTAHQERAFKCEKCGEMCTRTDSLKRHQKSNKCKKNWQKKLALERQQKRDDNNGEGSSGTQR